jgi:lipid II:glycine glycyltransferase (peptidoglycan interpeptide bridge formation enzyme)
LFKISIDSDINLKELDEFVFKNSRSSIFQTSSMAEVYRRNKGSKPLILTAINEKNGEIVASLLAKILEEKPGLLGNFSRHSTIREGPIFSDDIGHQAIDPLLRRYNEIVQKTVMYSRIYPLENIPNIRPIFENHRYIYSDWNNLLIDINKSKEELWKGLQKDKIKAVKKAKNCGLEFREIKNKDEVKLFYNLVKNRFTLRKNPLEDISNFEAVYDLLVPKGMAKFFFVEHEDNCISTRLVLLHKKKIYAWYSGSDNRFLKYHPNDFITWSVLEWGIDQGFELFDFGGGGTPDEQSAGWVEFKKRFGAKQVSNGRFTNVHQPIKLKFAENAFKIYKCLK